MYKSGIELPRVDFSIISCNAIAAGSYFVGFNLANSGKLSKMDCNGVITVIEGGDSSIYEEDTGINSAVRIGAGSVPSDYSTVSGGQCNLITAPSGAAVNLSVYQNPGTPINFNDAVLQDSTSGGGSGVFVALTITAGVTTIDLIVDPGQGYAVNDLITILGSQFSGTDGLDDVVLRVDGVTSGSAFIGGGRCNLASGVGAAVVGGEANAAQGYTSTIGGGTGNTACLVWSAVTGGANNTASSLATAIGGGLFNTASSPLAAIAGGLGNTASCYGSFIGGGEYNTSSNCRSTVSGGYYNTASGDYSTVGGGYCNLADSGNSTVGGGNTNIACNVGATVSGGVGNTASGNGSSIGGGGNNTASSYFSSIAGGELNTVSGTHSTVAGGFCNFASGCSSAILGGRCNNDCGCDSAFIIGSLICANRDCTTFVNSLSIVNLPTEADLPLPAGTIYKCTSENFLRIA